MADYLISSLGRGVTWLNDSDISFVFEFVFKPNATEIKKIDVQGPGLYIYIPI